MDTGLYRAASGMLLEGKRQEAIAQNLAGSSIPGFKRQYLVSSSFSDTLSGALSSNEKAGSMTSLGSTRYDFTPGVVKRTDRNLDFSFDSYLKQSDDPTLKDGEIFFQVQDADSNVFYTKNGAFRVNSDREIVTTEGYKVVGDGGPIVLGADDKVEDLNITSDGQVRINDKTTSPSTLKTIGTMQLVVAKNPQSLTRYTANYFGDPNEAAGIVPATSELFNISNGYLEDSNTSPMVEMNSMIESMRSYELHSKLIKSAEDLFRQEQSKLI